MLREFIKRILNRKKYDEMTRKKINLMFRVALNYYEATHKKSVDFPAFVYANRDIKKIIKSKRINDYYSLTIKHLKEDFLKEKSNAV